MKPKPQDRDAFELFQAHFDQWLNPKHALVPLARKIDWNRFETALASDGGRRRRGGGGMRNGEGGMGKEGRNVEKSKSQNERLEAREK